MAFIFYMNECRLPAEPARRIASCLRPQSVHASPKEPAMRKRRRLHLLAAAVLFGCFAVAPQSARSGGWPERTVRIITPFSPGISVDVAGAHDRRWACQALAATGRRRESAGC